jgi:hypothetical protein
MTNRILDAVVLNHRLDPIETELRIFVKTAQLTAATEIRGKLVGPRSVFASTVEIAYPMREIARTDHIELRVLIPEPNWWSPQSPFLYAGALELLQDGVVCDRLPISYGIRTVQLTTKGLRLNGKPISVRGRIVNPAIAEAGAAKLRDGGINTLIVRAGDDALAWSEFADRLGFFVIGTADNYAAFAHSRHDLAAHPSTLGWIFNRFDLQAGAPDDDKGDMLYGVNTSTVDAPPSADFLVCHERELAWLDSAALPKLVVTQRLPDPLPQRAEVIGWILTDV